MNQTDQYQKVEDAFANGSVQDASANELRAYLVTISNQVVTNDSVKHREVIRGLTLNHILLHRHIADLDRKNSVLQKVVLLLKVMSTIASIAQVWTALWPK